MCFMTTRNDITQDKIKTKGSSQAYREGFEQVFSKSVCKRIALQSAETCPRDPQIIGNRHVTQ